MELFTERFESNFKTRIEQGGRVYLSEVYKELGFEMLLPDHPAYHSFWDKNGFHENNLDADIDFDQTVMLINNDRICTAIEQAYNELGGGRIQPTRLFNTLARYDYIDTRTGETDISKLSKLSDKELLNMRGFGPESIKYFRRAIDILNGADPLPKKMYTIQVTFEELSSLRRIYERKKTETDLLKRIISNAILVE